MTAFIRKGSLISNVTMLRKRRKAPLTQNGFLAPAENCTDPLLCTRVLSKQKTVQIPQKQELKPFPFSKTDK